jgi:hypothetical protein
MTWLAWRQHRNQAYFAAAALAAFAVLITVTVLQMAATYRAALAACHGCGDLESTPSLGSPPVIFLVHQNFKPGPFDVRGIVPVGYALFAVALGVAAGAWSAAPCPRSPSPSACSLPCAS